MGGAEGKAGVDLKGEAPRGHLAPVVTAMHQKAAGAHRPPQAFRLRHPILGGKLLDPGQANTPVGGNAVDQLDQPLAGGLFGVMRRHFDLAGTALEQGHGHCQGTFCRFKSGRDGLGDGRGRLDGRDIGDWLGLGAC